MLRDVYRADLVSFWGAWPALGGIAYLGTPEGLSVLPWYAVSILSSPLATIQSVNPRIDQAGKDYSSFPQWSR